MVRCFTALLRAEPHPTQSLLRSTLCPSYACCKRSRPQHGLANEELHPTPDAEGGGRSRYNIKMRP